MNGKIKTWQHSLHRVVATTTWRYPPLLFPFICSADVADCSNCSSIPTTAMVMLQKGESIQHSMVQDRGMHPLDFQVKRPIRENGVGQLSRLLWLSHCMAFRHCTGLTDRLLSCLLYYLTTTSAMRCWVSFSTTEAVLCLVHILNLSYEECCNINYL